MNGTLSVVDVDVGVGVYEGTVGEGAGRRGDI